MNTEPILFSFAAIVLVLVLYLFLKTRIRENDLRNQIKEYDENSYS